MNADSKAYYNSKAPTKRQRFVKQKEHQLYLQRVQTFLGPIAGL